MNDTMKKRNEELLIEINAMETDSSYDASIKLQNVIKMAKKWNNSQTEYNRTQFLVAFNMMNERDQEKAVKKGSELSKILIGWCAATRDEIQNVHD